jgi:hypothetical protein
VIGWLVGVALLWTSNRWTPREKLAGTLLVPGGPGSVALLIGLGALTTARVEVCSTGDATAATADGTQPAMQCSGGGGQGAGIVLLVALVVAFVVSFVVPAVLFRRAARRARA